MIGPLLGGMIVDHYDMQTMFFVILSLFIIAIISFAMYDRPLRKSNKKLPLQS
ncbi:hypothetical protein [Geomicrobium sp. JCM 19055]|uniref:hypothetical protein n=1 Tax=Geomicrobium sp. JCM 19055 TaxID=1460649 RepID=UPI0022366531|nr:hypothetical protein [Geomicrobium sp. JCM 19055]